jgi:predicted amidohydrolase YtcJ
LRKGQPADVVVLDRDPERSTVDELRILPVVATMLGGEFTHRAL